MASAEHEPVLERGDVFFFYRPKIERERAEDEADVQRFYLVLRPQGGRHVRLLIVGQKRLPDIERHERFWGFVQKVASSDEAIREELGADEYGTETRGERHQGAARAAGEGVYAILCTDRSLHLAYELELPESPGEVQRALGIAPKASLVLSIKNPERGSPPAAGLREEDQAEYPERLQREFRGRRFDREDLELLDYEGAEFILVGARDNPEAQYGVELGGSNETPESAEIFRRMRLERQGKRVEPLLNGRWA